MTDLQQHALRCGPPTTFFVHVVACARCYRIYDKYRGYELSKVDGDLCPSPNPAQRVYRDEHDKIIQVGDIKTDHIHQEVFLPRPRINRWQQWRNRFALWWIRTFPSRQQREMITAMRGTFQIAPEIAQQYREGQMGRADGFDWYAGLPSDLPDHPRAERPAGADEESNTEPNSNQEK